MRFLLLAPPLAAILAASPADAALNRDRWDQLELDAIRSKSAPAAELLEKGEALGVAGEFEAAYALFRQVDVEVPHMGLPRRRECEVLTALGRREEAIVACTAAMGARATDTNTRALIRAFVEGPTPPTIQQASLALSMTQFESRRSPGAPAPTAMACDIAESIGDGAMLQQCAEKLQRLAPDDPETHRIVATMKSRCPPWRFWVGWLTIAAAVLGTLGDAARRRLSRMRRAPIVIAAAIILSALPSIAWADGDTEPPHGWLSTWKVDEDHPADHIPDEKARNADPLNFGYWIQDLALKAEKATKRGDHQAAIKFYLALVKAVPEAAVGYSRLCEEYEALGDLETAAARCGDAVVRDGAKVKDFARFVQLTLAKQSGPIPAKEEAALDKVIAHMREEKEGAPYADGLECEVAVRTSNVAHLRECTTGLAKSAPDGPETLTFQWALAVQEGKFGQARALIERAKALGVPVEKMQETTAANQKQYWFRVVAYVVALGLLFFGLGLARRALARRNLMSEKSPEPA